MRTTRTTITEEIISQDVTAGDIVNNPYFDANLDYRIVVADEEDGSWTDLYNSRNDDYPPAELMNKLVRYLTLGDNMLIVEVRA